MDEQQKALSQQTAFRSDTSIIKGGIGIGSRWSASLSLRSHLTDEIGIRRKTHQLLRKCIGSLRSSSSSTTYHRERNVMIWQVLPHVPQKISYPPKQEKRVDALVPQAVRRRSSRVADPHLFGGTGGEVLPMSNISREAMRKFHSLGIRKQPVVSYMNF